MDQRETNSDYDRKKKFANIHFLKNVIRQLLFLEIVSVRKIKTKLFICMCIKWWWGVDLINELLRKFGGRGTAC